MTSTTDHGLDGWARRVRGPHLGRSAVTIADPADPIEAVEGVIATMGVTQTPPGDTPLPPKISIEIGGLAKRREKPLGDFGIDGGAVADQQVLKEGGSLGSGAIRIIDGERAMHERVREGVGSASAPPPDAE